VLIVYGQAENVQEQIWAIAIAGIGGGDYIIKG
jgi:hypothetical protein